jgi:hypothetical protein
MTGQERRFILNIIYSNRPPGDSNVAELWPPFGDVYPSGGFLLERSLLVAIQNTCLPVDVILSHLWSKGRRVHHSPQTI